MEITSIKSFLDYYERIRERTNRVVQVIPPDKIDWSYKPGKFTIADIVRHIAAIERYMYAENVQGKPSCYHGCGKELADGYENIVTYFNAMHQESVEIFSRLSDEDLQRKCVTPGGGEITTWKWLRAMVEHEIHHRAQLYIYLNMLDVKTPPIFGLTAEEVQANSLK
ncbi:DinB family protein [Pontibacter sp. KCTC 32443]|uniref:DinB family protein n=1 Tax=Pontibacter TaxID=323449 RepID=UPI00164CE3F0|nr:MULTISPECIES: DinB family protein [Pontibacter]MBC5772644.1 DinB family protein [Pontibacter sp. KCTC 32443]